MPIIQNAGVRVGLGRIGYTGSGGPTGFTGSKGDPGAAGSPGGYSGSQGFTGSVGAQGPGGGYTGSAGAVGFTGSSGGLGYTGSSGTVGFTGSTGVGYTGSKGVDGSDGSDGAVGFTGSTGAGYSGSKGDQGTIGYSGSKGDTGSAGAIGYSGSKGDQGTQGTIGFSGSRGLQGTSGYAGSKGDSGTAGSDGSVGFTGSVGAGYTGSRGATGAQGPGGGYTGSAGGLGYSGSKGDQGTIGYSGSKGADGSAGTVGFSGSKGDQGTIGYSGSKGADGSDGGVGYSGSKGDTGTGFTGSVGTVGFTGSAGSGSDSPFVFTTSGDYRTLTGYKESGVTNTVRTAEFSSNLLRLTLATFTPSFSASGNPSSTNNWDVPATGFSVSVDNPSDVTNDFISSVYSITQTSGSVNGTLSNYSAGSYSQTPAGGVDWNQTFTVDNSSSYIRPISTSRTGGSAGATIKFNHNDGSESEYTDSNTSFSVNWSTASMSLSKTNVSGKTFLKSYASTSYSTNTSGISNSSNTSHALTASGGTLSTNSGSGYVSGTFTFTSPIHKDNTSDTRTVSNTCTFTRPVDVTGTSYTTDQSSTTSNISASFTYPSFWIWTTGVGTTPTLSDIIDDTTSTGFDSAVNQLADQTRTFSVQSVNNSDSNPRAFWFAVRNSASQPGTFKTGASAGLLSDVSTTDGGTITLVPDSPLSEQTGESYHLYGFTLQPGTTYVEIGA
jgi:hypothetical protein